MSINPDFHILLKFKTFLIPTNRPNALILKKVKKSILFKIFSFRSREATIDIQRYFPRVLKGRSAEYQQPL